MSYASVSAHRSMVFDNERNSAYAKEIRRVVGPESVVLDLGAGMGVLGLIAAQAGAKKVYLVEPQAVVRAAIEIASENNLSDRIVILEGKVEEVAIPEKVDLILSVMAGNLLFSEDLLPSFYHARDKYLKDGGIVIPSVAELVVAPVSAPKTYDFHVGRWNQPVEQLDFSAALRYCANEIIWQCRRGPETKLLAEGAVIQSVDMYTSQESDCAGEVDVAIQLDDKTPCHGILCWIRLKLGDTWLDAGQANSDLHWSPALFPLKEPIDIVDGSVSVKLTRPAYGHWTWILRHGAQKFRHSTFLSRLDTTDYLYKTAGQSAPGLSSGGREALAILQCMEQGKSNEQMATMLMAMSTGRYGDKKAALHRVQQVTAVYGSSEANT
ncbi:MAG: class I SAM-dependent methyltransferase [Pseudomonadales bacterium]